MHVRLLDLLVCPSCQESLHIVRRSPDTGENVSEGLLECDRCARAYPVVRGVPRFVETDEYASAFSFEWNIHRRTQFGPESGSREYFIEKLAVDPVELTGCRVLDAGCGTGRYTDVVADSAAEVVSIDLSDAVDVAQENCGHRPNVHVVQASITQLPFRPHTFDFIFSIGVLHHTPDPRESFLALTRVLRDGGTIAIWVYAAHQWLSYLESDFLRRYTTRMPPVLLYYLCYLAVPLYWLYQLPFVGRAFKYALPAISNQPKARWRVLDTFDWYAPRYQFKYTYPEIYAWFREAHIEEVSLGSVPIGMQGKTSLEGPVLDQTGTRVPPVASS